MALNGGSIPPAGKLEEIPDQPPVAWADAWLKQAGIRTTYREREQLILQFKGAMDYAVQKERYDVEQRTGANRPIS